MLASKLTVQSYGLIQRAWILLVDLRHKLDRPRARQLSGLRRRRVVQVGVVVRWSWLSSHRVHLDKVAHLREWRAVVLEDAPNVVPRGGVVWRKADRALDISRSFT
jgi:hypothetical protein